MIRLLFFAMLMPLAAVEMPKRALFPIVLPVFKPATASDPTLLARWVYPTNIALTNFMWDLYGSSDLKTWALEQTNCGPGDVFVHATNKFRFYRMKGR